jgi:hypothetical protein
MTTKLYNPDTREVVTVEDNEADQKRGEGFIAVGSRVEQEYVGMSREELQGIDGPPNMGSGQGQQGGQDQGKQSGSR